MSENNRHSQRGPETYGPIEYDVLTLCLRLCLEPADSHSPETVAVLEHYRPAWEAAAGGVPFDEALALLPQPAGPAERSLRERKQLVNLVAISLCQHAHPLREINERTTEVIVLWERFIPEAKVAVDIILATIEGGETSGSAAAGSSEMPGGKVGSTPAASTIEPTAWGIRNLRTGAVWAQVDKPDINAAYKNEYEVIALYEGEQPEAGKDDAQDAARYRWLKEKHGSYYTTNFEEPYPAEASIEWSWTETGDEHFRSIDEAVDAQRSATEDSYK